MTEKDKKEIKKKPKEQGSGTNPFSSLKGTGKDGKSKFNFYWIYGILFIILIGVQFIGLNDDGKQTNWRDLKLMLENNDVSKIILVNKEIAEIFIKSENLSKEMHKDIDDKSGFTKKTPHYYLNVGSVDKFEEDIEKAQYEIPESDKIYVDTENRHNWGAEILSWIFPIAILVGLWFFFMRMMNRGGGGGGGQIFNIGKSKAQVYDKKTSVNISFKDVAGLEEAKVEITEIVDFLKKPEKYTKLGGKIPRGVLLVGPPGTGKTLLAKSVAGEADVPFFSISGSDFVEMFVGVGASRVRDLFKQAKEKAPSIIFIDEIDAIGRARGKNQITGANDERENTLNQLLTEMDGFTPNSGVIILAATNRADILDKALMRAGRFDRQIHVELPDLEERKQIFEVHMKPLKLARNVKNDFLAKQTPGFSGADIANVCNESALIAARSNHKSITIQDFMDAIDRIIGGLEKKNKIISPNEKKVVAYHEAGHASISWLLEHAHPLVKVTIVPRGKALGAAWYLPEERQITTYDQMFDEMTAALGGRAAEQVIFGKISTGALNDLEKVTKQAYAMVSYFGLSKRIGNISYYDSTGQQEYSFNKPFSEKTAEAIDNEISRIVEEAYSRAIKTLEENKKGLEKLAALLLDKEVIFSDDLEAVFGKRPWGITKSLLEEMESGKTKDNNSKAKTKK
ncbi:MAG: ATP-dependent zinc metalloprotease FtsH [Bacteroidetes bacterium]|nr:ATP-dependent zinc metalloprotease FtsH [Bacteroidota bacterium]MBL6944807.1 ATP-dependent zinc metalloprotease FtsH [Bacteroidales bacterium]